MQVILFPLTQQGHIMSKKLLRTALITLIVSGWNPLSQIAKGYLVLGS